MLNGLTYLFIYWRIVLNWWKYFQSCWKYSRNCPSQEDYCLMPFTINDDHKVAFITIFIITFHYNITSSLKQVVLEKTFWNRLGILIWIFLHQVLDYHHVSMKAYNWISHFTLLLFGICWLLWPIYAIVRTNSLLLVCLCWLF